MSVAVAGSNRAMNASRCLGGETAEAVFDATDFMVNDLTWQGSVSHRSMARRRGSRACGREVSRLGWYEGWHQLRPIAASLRLRSGTYYGLSGCRGQPRRPGAHDREPEHGRHLCPHKRLAEVKDPGLLPWEQKAGNAERQPGAALNHQPGAEEAG